MNSETSIGRGVIAGRVLRASDGAPLKNVEVQLLDQHQRTPVAHTKTDSNGHFELGGLAARRYTLGIRHNPYVPTGKVLSLLSEKEIRDLEFRLVAAAAFVGKVEDEDGNLLSGVEVQALVKMNVLSQLPPEDPSSTAKLDMVPLSRAITNDRGEYRLYGLPPGEYFLSAVDTGMPHITESALSDGFMVSPADLSRTKYPPIYFPGTPEKARALSTPLGAGEEKTGHFSPPKIFHAENRRTDRWPRWKTHFRGIHPFDAVGHGHFIFGPTSAQSNRSTRPI